MGSNIDDRHAIVRRRRAEAVVARRKVREPQFQLRVVLVLPDVGIEAPNVEVDLGHGSPFEPIRLWSRRRTSSATARRSASSFNRSSLTLPSTPPPRAQAQSRRRTESPACACRLSNPLHWSSRFCRSGGIYEAPVRPCRDSPASPERLGVRRPLGEPSMRVRSRKARGGTMRLRCPHAHS